MNVLFLTLAKIDSLQNRGIYQDLMNEFVSEGHEVFIISPVERREKQSTRLNKEQNATFLNVRTLNIQKTNIIEKGLSTLTIELLFVRSLKKYLPHVKFDIVLYSTPPITFTTIVSKIKKRDGAKSYLLLKDIFPQNAVDMELMSTGGFFYNYFRSKEKLLYKISDTIGCMSPKNKEYVLDHNPEIPEGKVEINPNSIYPVTQLKLSHTEKEEIKIKYALPLNRKILIYGGNLGIPQGLDFLLETIQEAENNPGLYFVIAGSGTEYERINAWFMKNLPLNAKLLKGLPKEDYDQLMKACDIGLIFLDKRFTIPNFPSRLLSHLEFGMPLLVAADPNTDIGTEVEKNNCGISVLSGDIEGMKSALNYFESLSEEKYQEMGEFARNYLEKEFLVASSYQKIIDRC